MHQSPLKLFGGPRREKYGMLDDFSGEAAGDRRRQRGEQPKARRFHLREDGPREERGRLHPRS